MKSLMILVKMQLKERLNFKRLDQKNVKLFDILLSIVAAVVKFAKQRLDIGNLLHLFNTLQLSKCFNHYIFCQILYVYFMASLYLHIS